MASRPLTFLTLPLEIRFMIYEELFGREFGREPVSYPFAWSPIMSISQGPPPQALLRTCRQISDEIRTHYYSSITVRVHDFSFAEDKSQPLFTFRQARKVEFWVVLHWSVAERPKDDIRKALDEKLRHFVEHVKKEGHMINTVIISLREWPGTELLIDPSILWPLRGKVQFVVGDVLEHSGSDDELKDNLRKCLRELNE